MTIQKKTNGDVTEIALSGWMDTQSAPELKAAIDALDSGTTALVLDFKELEYTSSAGLRTLVAAHKKMNGNLTIRNVSGEIMDILKMAGFDKRLHIEA